LVASIAKDMNTPLEEVAAAFGLMADAGIKGSRAGTALRRAFVNLASPSKEMISELNRWKVELYTAEDDVKAFVPLVEELSEKFEGLTKNQRRHALITIFGVRAITGMTAIFNLGSEHIKNFAKQMREAEGATQAVAEKQMRAFLNQTGKAMQKVKELTRHLGSVFAPAVENIANVIGDAAEATTKWTDAHESLTTALVTGAAGLGVTLIAMGSLASLAGNLALVAVGLNVKFVALLATVGLVTAGIALLSFSVAYAIIKYKEHDRELQQTINNLRTLVDVVDIARKRWKNYAADFEKWGMTDVSADLDEVAGKLKDLQGILRDLEWMNRGEVKKLAEDLGLELTPYKLTVAWKESIRLFVMRGISYYQDYYDTLTTLGEQNLDAVRALEQMKTQDLQDELYKRQTLSKRAFSEIAKARKDDYNTWVSEAKLTHDTVSEFEYRATEEIKGSIQSTEDAFTAFFTNVATEAGSFWDHLENLARAVSRNIVEVYARMVTEMIFQHKLMQSIMGLPFSPFSMFGPGAGAGANTTAGATTLANVVPSTTQTASPFMTERVFQGGGGGGFRGAGSSGSWADGGVISGGFKAFAGGGIASRPTIGLVGEGKYNEAVVPLPDGKSIPVSLQGGKNVTFNVYAMDSQDVYRTLYNSRDALASILGETKDENHAFRRGM
jgi:hypothetical protein